MKTSKTEAHIQRLAPLLAQGVSVIRAGKQLGLSERQTRRLAASPECRKLVEDVQLRMIDTAVETLRRVLDKAASVYVAALQDPSPNVRMGAADRVFDRVQAHDAQKKIADRLAELESRFEKMGWLPRGTSR